MESNSISCGVGRPVYVTWKSFDEKDIKDMGLLSLNVLGGTSLITEKTEDFYTNKRADSLLIRNSAVARNSAEMIICGSSSS